MNAVSGLTLRRLQSMQSWGYLLVEDRNVKVSLIGVYSAGCILQQVHRAVLQDGRVVAMKVQYPGVAASINSDIDNVRLLLDYTNLIPKGLYLDQALNVRAAPFFFTSIVELKDQQS